MTDKLRRLAAEATPRPWNVDFVGTELIVKWEPKPGLGIHIAWWPSESWGETGREGADSHNAALIVEAVNRLEALLDVAERADRFEKATRGFHPDRHTVGVSGAELMELRRDLRETLARLDALGE